jgi:dTDP-4-dehydrorhamnose reductase
MWLAQKLKNNEPAKIVNDQYSSPTLADNLGETLLGLAESEETGVYHTAGKTRLNRYEFAVRIAQKLDFDEKLIAPIETSQLKQLARRPMDSSLKVEKIENDLRMRMLTIDEALNRFREQFLSGEEK